MAKFAICNEFCEGWEMARVFDLAARNGFGGVEIAPFTLADDVRDVPASQRAEIRGAAAQAGIEIVGLHWLLVSPKGLYVTHPNESIRDETAAYFRALIHLCGDLGGTKMVIGSPKQRDILPEVTYEQAWGHAIEVFGSVLPDAEECGVDLCIEPLARSETNFITTAAEGVRLCKAIKHPRFMVHLDVKAMSDEGRPYDEIIEATGAYVGHFHANDANRGYPGSGESDFVPVVKGLRTIGYEGWVSVEVFDFTPGPEAIASRSMDYLSRVFEEE